MVVNMQASELLRAGLVRRYHTVADSGRGQTNAEHSWGVATLIATYHPSPSVELLKAALYHDLSEFDTGDLPATAKWTWPGLGDAYRRAEAEVRDAYGWQVALTDKEKVWLRACDMLELYHYCQWRCNNGGGYEWKTITGNGLTYINKLIADGQWPPELDRAMM